MGNSRVPAEVSVEEKPEGIKFLVFSNGEADIATCPDVKDCFASHNKPGDLWAFNLTNLSSMDTEVIKVMIAATETVRKDGGEVAIISEEGSSTYKILSLLGIGSAIEIFPDDRTAIEMLIARS